MKMIDEDGNVFERGEPTTRSPGARRTCDKGAMCIHYGSHPRTCEACNGYDCFMERYSKNQIPSRPPEPVIREGSRPQMTSTGNLKRAYMTTSKSTQTFDSLIMECQDTLSIETEINKRYKEWAKKRGGIDYEPDKVLHDEWQTMVVASLCSFGVAWPMFYRLDGWLSAGAGIVFLIFGVFCTAVGPAGVVVSNLFRKAVATHQPRIKQPSESSKFEFLRDAYVGTIQNLNSRLDTIKDKIADQIQAHTKDELEIKSLSDLFEDTEEPLQRISEAVESLRESHKKVSDKQTEINEVLNEYIGENGYIAQKEKEIDRIKVAQELSERMQRNFGKTLEITKSVDVLADTIIPGIKQLMSFKIPELVSAVEMQCDTDKSFLQISAYQE